jgi:hypothetical protein
MTTEATTTGEPMTGRVAESQREQPGTSWRAFLVQRDPFPWLVGALALVLGGVFVGVDLAFNQGNLIAPLDDAYIHLQYGKQLGEGHPFEFNTGDPISTGASSLLYSFVLGAAYAVGFQGSALLAFAVALGVACLAITAGIVYGLGRTFAGRAVGIWSGVLVAVSGPLLWGAASGMEVGLTSLLVAGSILSFTRERPRERFVLTPVIAFLLALVRPEGLIVAVMISGAMVWTVATARRSDRLRTGRAVGMAAWALLPLGAGIGQYTLYRVTTGTFTANGVQSKSHLHDRPLFYVGDFVDRTVANVRGVMDLFNGLDNQDFTFPGALLFFAIGLVYLLVVHPMWRPLLVALGLGLGAVVVSVSTLTTALVHELRYFQPFMPIFIMLTVCGVYAITRLAPPERARRVGMHALLAVVLVFSLVALPMWALRLGSQAATIRDTDVSVGAWIRDNLPPDAIVAVKDVGAVAYFGERRVVDTVGLVTNGFAEASNNGTGAVYEELRKLPPGERPSHVAGYETPPGVPMAPLVDAGVLGPPLIVFPVRAVGDFAGHRIVPFPDLAVYRANWALAGSGDRSPVAGDVRDYLNVGDLESEEEHGYQPQMEQPGLQPYTVIQRQGNVIDSGRWITGGERFAAHDLEPGEPLTIVARVLTTGPVQEMRVLADGEDVGQWEFTAATDGEWAVQTFTVPGDAVTSSTVEVDLEPVRPFLSPYPEYTSFGFWFIQ